VEFRTMFLERLEGSALAAPCDLHREAIVGQTEVLLSRAIADGLTPEGVPFAQLCGAFMAFAIVPVVPGQSGESTLSRISGGWVAVTPGVNFEEARAVSREVAMAMADTWATNGPAEFHPEGPAFDRGSLVLPVRRVDVPDEQSATVSPRLLVTAIPGS